MYNIVINKGNAGQEAIERLNEEIAKGEATIAKFVIEGNTLRIITKEYIEAEAIIEANFPKK